MSEEVKAKSLQEQVQDLQQQNLIEGRAEIDAILAARGLTLVGVPQFAPSLQGWSIVVQVGVAIKGGEA